MTNDSALDEAVRVYVDWLTGTSEVLASEAA